MSTLIQGPLVVIFSVALSGCAIFSTTYNDTGSGADGGSADGGDASDGGGTSDGGAADGGAETDGGGGDGGGGDGGGGDGGGADGGADDFCDDDVNTLPPADDCVTDTLSCGQTITANMRNGLSNLDQENYGNWFCTVESGDTWDGPERIFAFEHPGTGTVDIELNSPCSDMDLAVVRWGWWASDGECPTSGTVSISECEMDTSSGGGSVSIYATEPSDYLIIVESVDAVIDLFQLSASCP